VKRGFKPLVQRVLPNYTVITSKRLLIILLKIHYKKI